MNLQRELDVRLNVGRDCIFTAFDKTNYREIPDGNIARHALVEFMCYLPYSIDTEVVAIKKSKRVTFFSDNEDLSHQDRKYIYKFDKDGRYMYHKYLLYTVNHPSIFFNGIYHITGKIFYHDGVIYQGIANTTTLDFNQTNTKTIYNWYDLKEQVSLLINYFYDKELFTICKLDRCLFELQRKAFFDGLKNCSFGACETNKMLKLQRDFLFITVYILRYLIDIGSYLEAQRIIEALATCGNLCDDSLSMNKRCGCG